MVRAKALKSSGRRGQAIRSYKHTCMCGGESETKSVNTARLVHTYNTHAQVHKLGMGYTANIKRVYIQGKDEGEKESEETGKKVVKENKVRWMYI